MEEVVQSLEEGITGSQLCVECGDNYSAPQMPHTAMRVSVEENPLKNFYETESLGLEVSYRCPKFHSCGECKRGDIFEEISVKEEA